MDAPWLSGLSGRDLYGAAAQERRKPSATAEKMRYRAAADRPRHRRCAEETSSPARVHARIRDLSIRDSGDDSGLLTFEGYASVTNTPYEMWDFFGPYTEQVSGGAFTKTLAQPDLDVPLVLQHADLRRIARTTNGSLTLTEDDIGLHTLAPKLDMADQDVAYIVPKLRAGLVDEMSFKFMIVLGAWSSDWMEYHIEEADIHRGDVAIVGYGANPYTAGAGLRSVPVPDLAAMVRGMSDEQARAARDLLAARLTPATTSRVQITDEDTRIRVI
jgi:HK97 family phage prohead protease